MKGDDGDYNSLSVLMNEKPYIGHTKVLPLASIQLSLARCYTQPRSDKNLNLPVSCIANIKLNKID